MDVLAAITNGADAFLWFTAMMIVIFAVLLVVVSR